MPGYNSRIGVNSIASVAYEKSKSLGSIGGVWSQTET